jgi:predicted MFS family arabinose efflux permease
VNPAWLLIAYLWVCYVLNHADRQVVYTLFPALQKEFGYSDAVLGLTGSLFLWVYGLGSPIAGILGDRWSKVRLVVGSLAVWSAFTVLSGLSPNGAFLLVCRALLGISECLFMPAAFALMANAHPPESRSKAISIFATSQLIGVAAGGSVSGYIAEHFHWRYSFILLGAAGILFAFPLWRFLSRVPPHFTASAKSDAAQLASFLSLFRIPSLRIVTLFVSIATFGLFLVYSWLPTFLYDKFSLGMARASFEASVYPQIGTALGLLTGGALADRLFRRGIASARFWVIFLACCASSPAIYLIGQGTTLDATRLAAIAFGFFAGFISGNQAASAFDVVPASLRASSVGVLNLLGASVSGFGPLLGGLARRTIGVDRIMTFTGGMYAFAALMVLYGALRHFHRDYAAANASRNIR